MLDITTIKSFFNFFKGIGELYKTNKTATILAIFSLSIIGYYNFDYVKEQIWGKKDITVEYVEKTKMIERDLRTIRLSTKASSVSIFLIHNGELTLSNLHLMKFTLLFQSSDTRNNHKFLLYKQNLAPYTDYFYDMMNDGYYLILDSNKHPDIIIRTVFEKLNTTTVLYVPLYKDGQIVGFATVSYEKSKILTKKEISDIIRLFDIPQSHL